MVIKSDDINELLISLFEKRMSRENAQKEAVKVRDSYDNGNIEFYPKESKDRILNAMIFIELYAERVGEGTYLYSEDDLIHYIKEKGWVTE